MSVKASKNDNKIYCESVAKSISNIIRFSLDEEFRKSCFELFGVSSTKEIEREISNRLMLITENEKRVQQGGVSKSKKRRKNLLHKKENQQELRDIVDKNDTNPPSSTVKDESQMFFQNFFQENELQISSQQYRNVIKRRNLGYLSQPELNQSNQKDSEFSKSNLKYSYSQPSAKTLHTLFYKEINSSSEKADDEVNCFQKMFTDSFKNSAQKYLKKNLKSYKKIHF